MKTIQYQGVKTAQILRGGLLSEHRDIRDQVAKIVEAVRERGDLELRRLADLYDRAAGKDLSFSELEITNIAYELDPDLKSSIDLACQRIEEYHSFQITNIFSTQDSFGNSFGQLISPIGRAGLYIPAGSASLFSTLYMLAIPARMAGVRSIVVTTPCGAQLSPEVAYILKKYQITEVYRIGGAHAVAALAYGTDTIRRVDKIFGPGSAYVNEAKNLVAANGVAIDLPAGPSEILIIADNKADPSCIASDLIGQAEHGPDSGAIVCTESAEMPNRILQSLSKLLEDLPRRELAEKSLSKGFIVLCSSIEECLEVSNSYCPEHLSLQTENAKNLLQYVESAGSIFVGRLSPEVAGDYLAGPNHVLPTNGAGRAFSGVGVSSFQKRISWQELSKQGLNALADNITRLARAEGLEGHARSVEERLKNDK